MAIYYKGQRMDGGNASGGGNGGVPPGFIGMWSGAADAVPDGWHICDGTEGTPDLRGRFVLGVNESHALGEKGGAEEVTLTVDEMPKHHHTHSIYETGDRNRGPVTEGIMSHNGAIANFPTSTEGGSQPHNNMPPYYALCYIMKL